MIEIFFWIIGVTLFTLFGSFYVKKYNRPDDIINIIKQDRKSYTNKLKFMLNLTNISVGETNSLNILKNIVEN